MKTIVLSISRGSLVRNFFRSDVVRLLLAKGYQVVIATPNYDTPEIFDEFVHERLKIEPLHPPKNLRFEGIIRELAKAAIFNETILARYRYRFSGKEPNKILYYPRLILSVIRFIPGIKTFVRYIDTLVNPQHEHDALIQKYKPSLVFITATHEYAENGLVKSAKRYGIPTAGMPKSWDNLSKVLFLTKNDKHLVWNEYMKEQAIRFQGYIEKDVVVTGAPQFDYYAHKENRVSREEFCQQFNFDPRKKIILYGSTGGNCFDEGAYVGLIQRWMSEGKLGEVQILMRPHLGYHNDGEKFKKYIASNCMLDTHDKQNMQFKDLWDSSEDHLKHLYNSMFHADVCVNIASTLTLDAAASGTPVINVNFDTEKNLSMNKSTKRLYTTDYINAVTHTGGTWLVESERAFLKALQEVLVEGKRKDKEQVLIERFIYKKDGKAAERIVSELSAMME